MKLLPAAPTDYNAVYGILQSNAVWLQEHDIVQWPLAWLQSQQSVIYDSIVDGHYFIARREDDIAAVVEVRYEPEALWGLDKTKCIYVHKLAVNRRFNGEGIGREILKTLINRARADGCTYVRLDCVASNNWLRNYYQTNGFVPAGVAHNGLVELALYQHYVND